MINVCEINRQRNYEDLPRPTVAPVSPRKNRGSRREQRAEREQNEMSLYPRSILLATDGSNEAELAAGVAVELAECTGAELHLVHVKLLPITPPYPEVLDWRGDLERADREARALLEEQVKKVEEACGAVAGAHLRDERPPADEIVALAEELGVGLIVVGSRHRGRIRRALTGSVPDRIVRRARCPVLVVGAGARVADGAGGGFVRITAEMLLT